MMTHTAQNRSCAVFAFFPKPWYNKCTDNALYRKDDLI